MYSKLAVELSLSSSSVISIWTGSVILSGVLDGAETNRLNAAASVCDTVSPAAAISVELSVGHVSARVQAIGRDLFHGAGSQDVPPDLQITCYGR